MKVRQLVLALLAILHMVRRAQREAQFFPLLVIWSQRIPQQKGKDTIGQGGLRLC
jgi:hypothetical protein